MKALLKLEFIGYDWYRTERGLYNTINAIIPGAGEDLVGRSSIRPWVARITGPCEKWGLAREFLNGEISYNNANKKGSRGVYLFFTLQTGEFYEVKTRASWKREDRYFCKVNDNGEIERINKAEAGQWAAQTNH